MQKQSQADKKQEERQYAKKFKATMEAQWAASECDFNNLFADKTSFVAYERQRMRQCFETVPSAEDRRARGQIKRRHSPTTMPFRTEDLIAEAKNFQPGCSINWTKLARKYDVPGANGGQIIKDFLREEGFNVDHVSPPRAQHARRKMKVLAANVKVPQQPSAPALKMEMINKIEDKQILTGEPCHETMVERFAVSENGSIQKEEVKVEGRIIPMTDLRRRILQDHEDKHLMWCHPSTYSAYSTMECCQF